MVGAWLVHGWCMVSAWWEHSGCMVGAGWVRGGLLMLNRFLNHVLIAACMLGGSLKGQCHEINRALPLLSNAHFLCLTSGIFLEYLLSLFESRYIPFLKIFILFV